MQSQDGVMFPFVEGNMSFRWIQHDNDPKHTSKLGKEWFTSQRVCVMSWPMQNSENPCKNTIKLEWTLLKSYWNQWIKSV